MRLCFIRHGIAEPASGSVPDFARELTDGGARDMRRAAAGMARLGLEMGAVLTSPLVRARQTAQIVAEALELTERTIVAEELDGRFCLAGLRRLVAGYGDVRGLGLVGHEPTFSMTIADLIGGGEIEVKKGSLAVVEADRIEPGAALLRMLLPPSVLREIGAAR